MPTTESSLARVLRALLKTGEVTLDEDVVTYPGYRPQACYRLTVNTSIVLDGVHGGAVMEVM